MIPVDMRILDHCPAEGRYGDCFRAVVASILELPYDDVPHVMAYPEGTPDVVLPNGQPASQWYVDLRAWLAPRGLDCITYDLNQFRRDGGDVSALLRNLTMYHDLAGPSPRFPGVLHSCVAREGRVVHDPHPSRTGIDVSCASFATIITVGGSLE